MTCKLLHINQQTVYIDDGVYQSRAQYCLLKKLLKVFGFPFTACIIGYTTPIILFV